MNRGTVLNNEDPAVSWVLCSNVANEQLILAINSCLGQSFKDFELVFVANGEDAEYVAESVKIWFGSDTRLRIFCTQVRHLSFSLALGLHYARGSLIARMDGDDISSLDRLEHQVAFMLAHPEVSVVGTRYEIINQRNCFMRGVNLPQSNKAIRHFLFFSNPLCHPSVMFRKNVVCEAGGYLGGMHAEDYDLWARLALNRNCEFANLERFCLRYRIIGSGDARRSRQAYASMASSQFRNFLLGGGVLWLLSSLISIGKLILRSRLNTDPNVK
jgi:cellulose synthase/poly-beta-1,6-N-acetylglucosamine synthase-like glycosyltransferase